MPALKGKSLAILLIALALIVGLIATLTLVRQQQDNRSEATASTTLSFSPNSTSSSPVTQAVNATTTFDVMLNPGTNLVSFAQLEINYDPAKFGAVTGTPIFQQNTAVLPVTVEGPFFSSGKVTVSMSIGNDASKAISSPVKVGTVTLRTLATTTSPTQISYGPLTKILSIGSNDQASENVLSSTTAAFVTIQNPSYKLGGVVYIDTNNNNTRDAGETVYTAGHTMRLDKNGTQLSSTTTNSGGYYEFTQLSPGDYQVYVNPFPAGYTGSSSSGGGLPIGSRAFTLSADNTNVNFGLVPLPSTSAQVTMLLHGIGNSGDNANPTNSSLSNKSPLRTQRNVNVLLYNNSNTLVKSATGTVTYTPATGNFKGTVDLGTGIAAGSYTIRIKTDQYLRRLVTGFINITPGQTITVPTVTLIGGDVDNNNSLNILDYNTIVGCYADLAPAASCTPDQKLAADLNDDGNVNQFDYNFFLRELSVQTGE